MLCRRQLFREYFRVTAARLENTKLLKPAFESYISREADRFLKRTRPIKCFDLTARALKSDLIDHRFRFNPTRFWADGVFSGSSLNTAVENLVPFALVAPVEQEVTGGGMTKRRGRRVESTKQVSARNS
jgi:hypothetical protein